MKGNRSSIAIYSTEQQKEYRQGQDEAQKLTEGTEVTITERGKRYNRKRRRCLKKTEAIAK